MDIRIKCEAEDKSYARSLTSEIISHVLKNSNSAINQPSNVAIVVNYLHIKY